MTEFTNYTDILLSALKSNPRAKEAIAKKQEILDSVYLFHNISPKTTLYVGFNPAIMSDKSTLYITAVSESVQKYLRDQNIKFEYIDYAKLTNHKQFDSVIAFDEFFTFASTDLEQQQAIQKICDLAGQVVISTIKDYKNQDFKDREFSNPALVRNGDEQEIYLEFHDWNPKDRAAWTTTAYEISNPSNGMQAHGPFKRRTMYFKQLAKFSMDAGAVHFQVHKNLMYKSLIKKNYEHVISIIFE